MMIKLGDNHLSEQQICLDINLTISKHIKNGANFEKRLTKCCVFDVSTSPSKQKISMNEYDIVIIKRN